MIQALSGNSASIRFSGTFDVETDMKHWANLGQGVAEFHN